MSFYDDNDDRHSTRTTTRSRTEVRDLRTGVPLYSSEEIIERDAHGHPIVSSNQTFGKYACGHEFGEARPLGAPCTECGRTQCLKCEEDRTCVNCSRALCRDHVTRLKNPETGQREPYCASCKKRERWSRIGCEIWRALTATPSSRKD